MAALTLSILDPVSVNLPKIALENLRFVTQDKSTPASCDKSMAMCFKLVMNISLLIKAEDHGIRKRLRDCVVLQPGSLFDFPSLKTSFTVKTISSVVAVTFGYSFLFCFCFFGDSPSILRSFSNALIAAEFYLVIWKA
jgi:hypothetical protein